ncbi:Salivary glue protein Sgs-4 [Chionoecetes opilio]|uniref:Salivary glue protein Sgs-4 n=1 Tax=Chionoecetes opilio TaxID=41210 RepID=A0A8J4Y1H8_CHIOP|nr:Salivary glue protein Sgs-4 [Chionoecetes opilio]
MRVSAAGLVALLCHLALTVSSTGAWDVNFKRDECYKYGLENLPERMPATLGNLVALLEKMEGSHAYTNPDAIAEALIHRYRIDGITYASPVANTFWDPNDNYEVNKADLLKSLVTMDQIVPDFTFESREECAIHFMLSHSVDLYPHPGLDYVWENSNLRQRRRRRRDAQAEGRYGLPLNIKPAPHPIENGVIWTPSGPVAAGTLLAGIMVTDTSQGMTIGQIYQSTNLEFMPDLMQQKRVMPLHAATLAGDIGQSALVGYVVQVASSDIYLGPQGMFANSTAAPKLFTLERNYNLNIPYLTRAEVYAGIDSLLIQKVLMESSNNQLSLSEALRMYYSDHGLPNYPDYKACNRMAAFRSLDLALIEEQALICEKQTLICEKQALICEKQTLICERQALICEKQTLICEKQALICEKQTLICERQALICERQALICERQALICEKQTLICEKQALICEKQTLICEKQALICEKQTLICEKQTLICEKQTLICEKQALICEKQTLICERQALICEKQTLICEKQTLICEKQTLICEKQALICERQALICEKQTLIGILL